MLYAPVKDSTVEYLHDKKLFFNLLQFGKDRLPVKLLITINLLRIWG